VHAGAGGSVDDVDLADVDAIGANDPRRRDGFAGDDDGDATATQRGECKKESIATYHARNERHRKLHVKTTWAAGLGRSDRLRRRIPAQCERARIVDVRGKVDLSPFLAVDVERPHVARLRNMIDHPEV